MAHKDIVPFCMACGYDLRGLDETRCPECGEVEADWHAAYAARRISTGSAAVRILAVPSAMLLLFVAWMLHSLLSGDSAAPFLLLITALSLPCLAVGSVCNAYVVSLGLAWNRASHSRRPPEGWEVFPLLLVHTISITAFQWCVVVMMGRVASSLAAWARNL